MGPSNAKSSSRTESTNIQQSANLQSAFDLGTAAEGNRVLTIGDLGLSGLFSVPEQLQVNRSKNVSQDFSRSLDLTIDIEDASPEALALAGQSVVSLGDAFDANADLATSAIQSQAEFAAAALDEVGSIRSDTLDFLDSLARGAFSGVSEIAARSAESEAELSRTISALVSTREQSAANVAELSSGGLSSTQSKTLIAVAVLFVVGVALNRGIS